MNRGTTTLRTTLLLFVCLAVSGGRLAAGAEEPQARSFADLQVRSTETATEVRFDLPARFELQDRTQKRPGEITVDEVRLFFPGVTLERSRLVTVGDRIVEEARLFNEGGGVVLTVVVRRPVHYEVDRKGTRFRLRVEPGTLLAEEPETPDREKAPTARRRPGIAPKVAVQELRAGEGLTVDAQQITYDQEKNEIVARGQVTIARAGSLLTADEVRVNRDTKIATARGNVEFTDPQGTVRARQFRVDLTEETGTMLDAQAYFPANQLTIKGRQFDKSYGQTYSIQDGSFTTCQCGAGAPSWSVAGDKVDITLDGYGLVKGGTFRVMDTPILYLPWAAFPAKRTRQTGLLAPQLGYSQKRGFEYLQPLYVTLNKSADATFSVDVETQARVGGIGEYRWALDPESKGAIDAAIFDETIRGDEEDDIVNERVADPQIPDQRWSVTATAKQNLPFGMSGFVDALAVSDDFYLREIPTFSFDPEYERTLRTSRFSSTRGGMYKLWDRAVLIGEAVYYQDFIQEDDLTLQRLPQMTFYGSQRFLDRHVKVRMNAEAVNFQRNQGFDGPRADLFPSLEVPFRFRSFFRGTTGIGFRETAYYLSNQDVLLPVSQRGGVQMGTDAGTGTGTGTATGATPGTTTDPNAPALLLNDTSPTRELFQANAGIGTELFRVFEVNGEDVSKLKHTLEPQVRYVFIPDVDQNDLPIYDFTDRINQRNLFTYGFTSRLLAKLTHVPTKDSQPLGPGDLNSFTGASRAPFGDERTPGTRGIFDQPEIGDRDRDREEDEGTDTEEGTARARRRAEREDEEGISHVVEWAQFSLYQSYDLDESLRTDRTDHLSDADVGLRINPVDYFSLLTSSAIDSREAIIDAANVGFLLRDPRPRSPYGFLQSGGRASVAISYRFISNQTLQELDGGVMVPFADTLSAFYQTRYDALAREFLENRFGFRLISQCQCWIFDFYAVDQANPDEFGVRTQVTLVGLGSIGRTR